MKTRILATLLVLMLLVTALTGCQTAKPAATTAASTTAAAYRAARSAGITLLSILHAATGDLNRVRRLVKALGFVNCTEDFGRQPAVINGFSELMVQVFGAETGAHARSAIGVNALPGGIPVEVELLVELK